MNPIETVYPLSPMQQGMLFHTITAPESAEFTRQLSLTLEGELDTKRFRAAWQAAVDRHASLRTAFVWENVPQPVQAVMRTSELRWTEECWQDLSTDEQDKRFAQVAAADRADPFALSKAPLMRCTLHKLGRNRHLFIWTFHHIVVDGWSLPLILRDVLREYQTPGALASSPSRKQYREFIAWLKRLNAEAAERFWRQELAGFTSATPIDLGESTESVDGFGEVHRVFDGALHSALRSVARGLRVSVNAVLQGVWALLLSRYSGQDDVLFGAVVSGRPPELAGSDEIVGLFINTIPVRARVPDENSTADWLRSLHAKYSEAREHEHAPLARIQEWSDVARRDPLFHSLFVFENYPASEELSRWSSGLAISNVASYERTNFPLTLTISAGERLEVHAGFTTQAFNAKAVSRILTHFETALASILADPYRPVRDIDVVPPAERELLLEWNSTRRPYPLSTSVVEIAQRQAEQTPNSLALVFEDRSYTYREFNQKTNQLARFLLQHGVKKGDPVGVAMERSADLVFALHACMRAGAAYVPLGPDYPRERLAMMLADAQPSVVLATTATGAGLPLPENSRVIYVDAERQAIEAMSGEDGVCRIEPEDIAYIIYTSGSTGTPKGAMNRHISLTNRLLWMQDEYKLNGSDRILQKTPYSFDVSVWEFFWPFMTGATLVVATPGGHKDPAYLADIIRNERITTLHFVPSMLQAFLASEPLGGLDSLRRVICSGEALSHDLQERFFALLPHIDLHNLYGPTEAAIDVTYWECQRDCRRKIVPIGHPIANTQIHILDRNGRMVPPGVTGELYIGGTNVARGYLNRPSLTAERFVDDPFSDVPGAKMYRTGDLARHVSDGTIEYLGRIDTQVKIRGFRIELGEIEAVLRAHPAVADAAVAARDYAGGDKRLVGYIVWTDSTASPNELRTHLSATLPDYMVPSAFVTMQSLPLSSNGKLDRRGLPEPEDTRPDLKGYQAPTTAAELALARIWADVLRLKEVGVDDEFFALGGDSILSLQIISRARQAGYRITAKQIFAHPTVRQLALTAELLNTDKAGEQGLVAGDVPLTPVLDWFLQQNLPQNDYFNQAMVFEVPAGGWRPDIIERAFACLAEHHDALRSRLRRGDNGWQYTIAPVNSSPAFEYHDLSTATCEMLQSRIAEVAERLQTSLNLAEGPIMRAAYLNAGDSQAGRLIWVIHHIAVDGVSWRILVEDLQSAYAALLAGNQPQLPRKTSSVPQWAKALHVLAQREQAAAQTSDNFAVQRLPKDFANGRNDVASQVTATLRLSQSETTALLKNVCAPNRINIEDMLLAASALAISEWTGEDDVQFDTEGHGREEFDGGIDVSRTVGWFTTIYPERVHVQRDNLLAFLGDLKQQRSNAAERGFRWSLRRLRPGSTETSSEILFNYLGQWDGAFGEASGLEFADELPGGSRGPENPRHYLLDVNCMVLRGELQILWTYSRNVHNESTIRSIVQATGSALDRFAAAIRGSEKRLFKPSDFPLAKLTEEQLANVVQRASASIEDIYPLSPMQRGLLFHAVSDRSAYVDQLTCLLQGEIEPAVFTRAWHKLATRYPVLRTAFVHDGVDEPLQVVYRDAVPAVAWLDWTDALEPEQEQRLQALLAKDAAEGFDTTQSPLMRVHIAALASQRYRMVWSWSHLLVDGWSLAIVLRDLFALLHDENSIPEPEASTSSYRDFISWIRKQDEGKATEYWQKALAGFRYPTPLPPSEPESAVADYRQEVEELSGDETEALIAFARRSKLTVNTLVQGAWAVLLSRCAGEEDVVFGCTVSGRPTEIAGLQQTVGLFINTLPLRLFVDNNANLIDWLGEVQRRQVEMQEFEFRPLGEIQQMSEVQKGTPLFGSLIAFENYPVEGELAALCPSLRPTELRLRERSSYPLNLFAAPGSKLLLGLLYDTSRFNAAGVRRILRQLGRLLQSMPATSSHTVGDLQLVAEPERHQVVVGFNSTETDYGRGSTVKALFEQQVLAHANRVAVRFSDVEITYAELNQRANQIANALAVAGVRAGDIVATMLPRNASFVAAILGIVKAGAAYLPIDSAYPAERKAFMLADSRAKVVLIDTAFSADLATGSYTTLSVQDCVSADKAVVANPPDLVGAGDPIYVMYTSGSTGTPKATVIPHRGVVRLVRNSNYIAIHFEDRIAQASNVSFDAATFEIWGALLNGAQLVGIEREVLLRPHELVARLRQDRISVMFITTALFHQIADHTPDGFRSLRVLLTGGEASDAQRFARVLQSGGPEELLHVYGPTETTTYATYMRVTSVSPGTKTLAIGRPISNTQAYVLDSSLRPVGLGVPGEICIGGDGVALGYWQRPELTAEKFVAHPFSSDPKARLYRTGDLGRFRDDGNIEFLGRIDNQVKFRGFRIELGEIEAALRSFAPVQDAVALLRDIADGQQRLCVYFTAVSRTVVDVAALRAFLKDKLPDYMVPATMMQLDAMPLNVNGKIDRRALPSPEEATAAPITAPAAPSNDTERMLVALWQDLLRIKTVGVHDNFFDLGGDSILSIQLSARAKRAGIDIKPTQLFTHQTIAELATLVESQTTASAVDETRLEGDVPLSPVQHWLFEQSLESAHHFNHSVLLEAPQGFDASSLRKCLAALVEQHAALRFRYVRDENAGWRQICLKSAEIPVEVHDLTSLPAPEQQERYAAIALRLQSSLHLETGPTGAAAIFHMRPSERPKLLLTFHHLIMDGVSWRIFLEQLEGAYGDLQSRLPICLPPEATSYHAWVAELTKYAESPAILDQAEYWRTVANTPVRPLPTDCDGENNVGSTANVELEFTKEETARLLQRSSGAAQGSDAYIVLATALVQTLTHWTNDSVLAVDFEGHGRENIVPSVDVSRTIGWFTAIYPVVLRNVNRGTPAEALAETKRILNEVPGRGLGYGLLRYLSPDRALAAELGEGLQPQVAFNYLGQFGGGDDTGTRFAFTTGDTGPARDAGQKRKHLIEVNAIIVGGRLQVYWTHSKNRHRPDMVAELAAAYRRAVSGLLASEPATAKNVADKLSVKDRSALLEQIQKAGAQK